MLYLQHGFYNILFKIKHKLYIASVPASPPPPTHTQGKILGAHLLWCNDIDRGRLKNAKRKLSQCKFVVHKAHVK
jgi:hypothetical protein